MMSEAPPGPVCLPSDRHTILVAEDEDAVREIVADVLVQAGFRVLEAASGAEALAILGRTVSVDLLFTDIRMPGMDGFELAEAAQRLRPDLKVLFTTGYTVRPPGREMMVLRKPYRLQQLISAVQSALGAWVGRRGPSAI